MKYKPWSVKRTTLFCDCNSRISWWNFAVFPPLGAGMNTLKAKSKGYKYSLPSVGPGADPDVRQSARRPQVTISQPPCGSLSTRRASRPIGRYQVILLGEGGT